jgi:indolepyruvate ferredoxin oxidoreductase alpha subunit
MARLAKVPVLDPSDPQEAREMVGLAMDISEEFRIPVILRPAIRVSHARQNISFGPIKKNNQKASFEKNPQRWAATPRFRLVLHGELNKKLNEIGKKFENLSRYNFHTLELGKQYPLGSLDTISILLN